MGNEMLFCVILDCHAGEVIVSSNTCTEVKVCGDCGFGLKLGLPVSYRGSLAYLGVEALVPSPSGDMMLEPKLFPNLF
jgi:hypothetical protein